MGCTQSVLFIIFKPFEARDESSRQVPLVGQGEFMNRNEMIEKLVRFLVAYQLYRPETENQLVALVRHLSSLEEVQTPEVAILKIRSFNLLPDVRIQDQAIIAKWRETLLGSTQSLTQHQSRSEIVDPRTFGSEAMVASQAIGVHRKILKKIGEGGMGVVLLVMNQLLGRREVIKLMKGEDPEDIVRFRKEAQAMAQVNHPNVVQILEVGTAKQDLFLVLEFVEGETLKSRLKQNEVMDFASALKLIRPAIAGVQSLHERGIIHRDLKPENLMIRAKNGELVVLDLGLAKQNGGREASVDLGALRMSQDGSALTQTGQLLGTPQFMAPEQACGEQITPSTDIWAFGAILFEMLSGERLNQGVTMIDTLTRLLKNDLSAFAREKLQDLGLPEFCIDLVANCVHKSSTDRMQSCQDLLDVVDGYFAKMEEERIASVERGIAAQQLLSAKQKRITQLLWAGVIVALLFIGLIFFFAWGRSESEKRVKAEAGAREEALARVKAETLARQEAEARFNLAESATRASAQVEAANQHISNGRWKEAKTLLEGVLVDFPEQRNARRLLVRVYDVLEDSKRIEHCLWLAQQSSGTSKQNYLLQAVMGIDAMQDTTVEAIDRQLEVADPIIEEMVGLHLDMAKILRALFAANRLTVGGGQREGLNAKMQALRKAGDFAKVSHESWETRFLLGLYQVLSSQLAWAFEPNMQRPSSDRLRMYMAGWSTAFSTMNEAARANPDYHMTLYYRQLCRRELARLIRLDTTITQERRAFFAIAELAPAFQDLERLEIMRPGSPQEALNVADCALELAAPVVYTKDKRRWYVQRALQHLKSCEERLEEVTYAPMKELVYLVSAKAHALNWQLNEDAEARTMAREYLNRAQSAKKDGEHNAVYLTVNEMIQ